MPTPGTQLLLVGDLHYDLRQFDWLVRQAPEFDLVVIVGDLLDISSVVPLTAQVPVMLGYLERLAALTSLVVSSGNHDLTGADEAGEQAALWLPQAQAFGVVTDYGSHRIGDALITVCPWWDGPVGRDRLERMLEAQAADAPDQWIWVYHWPPPDLPVSWIGHRSYGDADLAAWIERFHPSLVLTGHVHQPPWVEGGSWIAQLGRTWIINAGRQVGDQPSHAIVDLDAWTASWWSYYETGERDLA